MLTVRPASQADRAAMEALILESFEPITWQKKLDQRFGPLQGQDWRARWRSRLAKIFATQTVLVGEVEGVIAAMASAAIDRETAQAFIDVLAVARAHQGQGFGREMLKAAMDYYRQLGCQYVHLDCLTDNPVGNSLYASEGFEEVARHIRWFRKL